MRAFADDQRWAAQSYVAVAPGGQDPVTCGLSPASSPSGALVEGCRADVRVRRPHDDRRFDLGTAEAR